MFYTQHTRQESSRAERGFTLIELVVVVSIVVVILPILGIVLVNSYHEAFRNKALSEAESALHSAFDVIEKDVMYGVSFSAKNTAPHNDYYGTHSGKSSGYTWNYSGSGVDSRVMLIKSHATSTRDSSTVRTPVFAKTSKFNCTTQMRYQDKINYLVVYFIKDSTLFRRVLTDTTTERCPGQTMAQKQSCPAVVIDNSSDLECKARDEVIARNVSKFSVQYYNSSGDVVAGQYEAGGDDRIIEAESADISLEITVPQSNYKRNQSMRVTMINSGVE